MNEKLSPFQLIFFSAIIIVILAGVLIFSLQRHNNNNSTVQIRVWGTYSANIIEQLQEKLNLKERDSLNIAYTEFPESEFNQKLTEALASGNGPDMVITSQDFFLQQENKIYKIPYDKDLSQKNFKDNFVEAGEFLLYPDGIMGFPIAIDPLVMYWNRSILNSSGVSVAPQSWNQFTTLVQNLVVKDSATNNISKAGVALGEFQNIKNAREIFLNLMFQSGNPVVVREIDDEKNTKYKSVFSERLGYSVAPADLSLNFFTQFVDPTKNTYSWNRSLPNSQDMFLSNDLAFYFGFSSEYKILREKNPNLNFDVAQIPQTTSNESKVTYAKIYYASIMKSSKNIIDSLKIMRKLIDIETMSELSQITQGPSVNRQLLTIAPDSSTIQTFNSSALISKTFLDPNPEITNSILKNMTESFTTGRSKSSDAILKASAEFNNLIKYE